MYLVKLLYILKQITV